MICQVFTSYFKIITLFISEREITEKKIYQKSFELKILKTTKKVTFDRESCNKVSYNGREYKDE